MFFIKEGEYIKSERYSRHALFYRMSGGDPKIIQSLLQKKTVALVGCGGIGNLLGVTLATSGVVKLVIIDDDVIELSNLTRKIMFNEHDLGQLKTEILKRELNRRTSSVIVESICEKFDSVAKFELLPPVDLVVVSGDSPNICVVANDYCFNKNTPFIHVGYVQDVAVWGPMIVPGKTPCYRCFKSENISDKSFIDTDFDSKIKIINNNYQAPSIGPVNMLTSAQASLDILKYLGGFGEVHSLNKRVGIWTHNLEKQTQTYNAQDKCKICWSQS